MSGTPSLFPAINTKECLSYANVPYYSSMRNARLNVQTLLPCDRPGSQSRPGTTVRYQVYINNGYPGIPTKKEGLRPGLTRGESAVLLYPSRDTGHGTHQDTCRRGEGENILLSDAGSALRLGRDTKKEKYVHYKFPV